MKVIEQSMSLGVSLPPQIPADALMMSSSFKSALCQGIAGEDAIISAKDMVITWIGFILEDEDEGDPDSDQGSFTENVRTLTEQFARTHQQLSGLPGVVNLNSAGSESGFKAHSGQEQVAGYDETSTDLNTNYRSSNCPGKFVNSLTSHCPAPAPPPITIQDNNNVD